MNKKIFFFLVLIGLGIFVWFYNTQNAKVESSFDKAVRIMQGLQSRAIPLSFTEDQMSTLESAYQDSLARITSIRDFRDADKKELAQKLSEAGLSGGGENGLNELGENLMKLTLGKPDDFKSAFSAEIQKLNLDTSSKDVITKKAESVNTLSNDIRITSLYINWYEQLRPTLCTTNDPNNDPQIAGKLNLVYKNETLSDSCVNGALKQYKCVNGVYKTESSYETSVVCQNGCGDGVCLTQNKSGFEITSPGSTKVGESLSIRIKAIGSNGEPNTNYDKNFFVVISGDDDAEFPTGPQRMRSGESTITLSGVKFSKAGTMKLVVRGQDGIEGTREIIVNTADFVCPQLSPPPADFCSNGKIVDGGKDEHGCQLAPTCVENPGSDSGSTNNQAQVKCTNYPTPSCANGHIVAGGTDANGCTAAPTCVTCPEYTAPAADFCAGGKLVGGGTNEIGCQVPPTCEPNVTTGTVSINEAGKDCWFGDVNKRITLGEFLGYQSSPGTNSGLLVNSDAIGLFGSTAPSSNSSFTNLLTYEDINGVAQWKGDGNISNSTQLTNFFVFRTTSEGTRTWDMPTNGIKFYGCFTRGDKPTIW